MHGSTQTAGNAAFVCGLTVALSRANMNAKHSVVLLFLSAVAACQFISGAEDFAFGAGTTATGGAASAGTAGGAGGTGGGIVLECYQAQDCPGQETSCALRTCVDNMCGVQQTLAGTACVEDGGKVCNGSGACVECLQKQDCEPSEECDKQLCVPATCANMALDAGESDVDCGGTVCAPCDTERGCLAATDCASLYCAEGGAGGAGGAGTKTCAECGNDTHCDEAPNTFCADGACVPDLGEGEDCGGAAQCATGHCVDGVCCDSACVGECVGCHIWQTNSASGSCLPIPNNSDPNNECLLSCNGAGACQVL
jgi:hypothetical protein